MLSLLNLNTFFSASSKVLMYRVGESWTVQALWLIHQKDKGFYTDYYRVVCHLVTTHTSTHTHTLSHTHTLWLSHTHSDRPRILQESQPVKNRNLISRLISNVSWLNWSRERNSVYCFRQCLLFYNSKNSTCQSPDLPLFTFLIQQYVSDLTV